MPLGTLLLGLALLIIIVVVVALPLLDRKTPAIQPPDRREALEQARRATISAIRELDFDYRTGKISAEDYKRLREAQVARGAQILRELDALSNEEAGHDTDAEIEAQVAHFRTVARVDGHRRAEPADRVICPSCGRAAGAKDRFCPQCGQRLDAQTSQAGAVAGAD